MTPDPLASFTPSVRDWFRRSFEAPTDAQREAWPAIAGGENVLVSAPTGSGKTLAAFLWGLDRLVAEPSDGERRTRLVYVSPLKALSYDVEKNLRAPLKGIGGDIDVAIRTGDTPQKERQQMLRTPPDVLITTPESLYLMLTSRAREFLSDVECGDRRRDPRGRPDQARRAPGALARAAGAPVRRRPLQRIGLSATQRPLEEVGRFLVGVGRDCRIVDTGVRKPLDLEIRVPVEDMREPGAPDIIHPEVEATGTMSGGGDLIGMATARPSAATRRSIWPAIYPQLLELVQEHRSTIIFVNNRRGAERLAVRLNELAGEDGDAGGDRPRPPRLARPRGAAGGRGPAQVRRAAVPGGHELAGARHRHGRGGPGAAGGVAQVGHRRAAAHRPRRPRRRRGLEGPDLPQVPRRPARVRGRRPAACATARSSTPWCRATRSTCSPSRSWRCRRRRRMAGGRAARAGAHAPTRSPSSARELLDQVLDMLDGRYPSEEFAELRPRIVWDRVQDTIRARKGALQLAVTNAGTIPDRGLYGVHLPDGRRVGELDEEMVYEARPGQTFLLGASTWRIEEITRDRVIVSPAPGRPGRGAVLARRRRRPPRRARPGDRRVRPRGGGQASPSSWPPSTTWTSARPRTSSPTCASSSEATRVVPSDRTIVVERFRDEIGDWRLCVLSPLRRPRARRLGAGAERAHPRRVRPRVRRDLVRRRDHRAPARRRRAARLGPGAGRARRASRTWWCASCRPPRCSAPASARTPPARCSCRARDPGKRTPLWQQRLKAQSLLEVAKRYGQFPIVLETYRECLRDVFDLPGLQELLRGLHTRELSLVEVETQRASPFASSLLFDYVATYMYEGDAPNAERRAAALSLDRDLLRELLGQEELRELIDPAALDEVEADLQRTERAHPGRERGRAARRAARRGRPDRRRGRTPACLRGCPPSGCWPTWWASAARRAMRIAGEERFDRLRGRRPVPRRPRRRAAGRPARGLPGRGRRSA